jgi:hypothetical protein
LFTLRVRTSAGTESDNALSDEERMVVRLLKKRSVAKARRPRARSSKPA